MPEFESSLALVNERKAFVLRNKSGQVQRKFLESLETRRQIITKGFVNMDT
jgi:hypothetical protein